MSTHNKYIKFYPVLLVYPIWLFIVISQNLWYDIFSTYWPATIGMIFGSFIAGSTPLGGGVVAFPIAVLILNFTSSESRDASVLVQTVGMNAAAFLLITTKSYLLNASFIYTNIAFGGIGMLLGLAFNESPELTNLIYTVTVLCFGIIYFYTNVLTKRFLNTSQLPLPPPPLNASSLALIDMNAPASIPALDNGIGNINVGVQLSVAWTKRDYVAYSLMGAFGILGGFITASVGSGSDIAVFIYGIYVWNVIYPERQYDDNTFTASSVVVMGAMSALTVVTRALQVPSFTQETMLCWGAMSFIVVLGAPTGSLVLTPSNLKYLQAMFYLLAVVQFILFAVLKIGSNLEVWIMIIVIVSVVVILLSVHFLYKRSRRDRIGFQPIPVAVASKSVINYESDVTDVGNQSNGEFAEKVIAGYVGTSDEEERKNSTTQDV